MAEVIQFPKRTETQTLHFDEKHAFGEIGGLMLSLVQERDKADAPYTLVLLGGAGLLPAGGVRADTGRLGNGRKRRPNLPARPRDRSRELG